MSEQYFPEIVGKNPAILSIKEFIKKVSMSELPVLIEGESGTGKELVANAIHKNGSRAKEPFIAINCGAIPRDLIENELFGHEAGAFTGATTMKRGLFEVADKGTLFIDEIGEMDIHSQSKLLRVLETGAFRRLGSTREYKSDVRIIAATNKVLEEQITKEKFRSDLYYRLSVLRTFLPPLRERASDIPILAEHICTTLHKRSKTPGDPKRITESAMTILCSYSWPGNVRELINILSTIIIVSPGKDITIDDIPDKVKAKAGKADVANIHDRPLDEVVEAVEKEYISTILGKYGRDKEKTMKVLGISRAKFYRKLKKYSLL